MDAGEDGGDFEGMNELACENRAPTVPGLSLCICPAAILLRVVSVRVNPVEGGVRWFGAHVPGEALEISPAITDLYAPTTVVLELWVILISATLDHISPAVVNVFEAVAFRAATHKVS